MSHADTIRDFIDGAKGQVYPTKTESVVAALDAMEAENQQLRDALEALRSELHAIRANAESWHGDDVAKGRALAVISRWATDALDGTPSATQTLEDVFPDKEKAES
jgi:hypothetical protein